jgi:hypothetical protein
VESPDLNQRKTKALHMTRGQRLGIMLGVLAIVAGVSLGSQLIYCLLTRNEVVPRQALQVSLTWPLILGFFALVRKLPRDLRNGARRREADARTEWVPMPNAEFPWLLFGAGLLFWYPLGVGAATALRARTNEPTPAGDLFAQGLMLGLWVLVPVILAGAVASLIWLRKPNPSAGEHPLRKLLP